MYQFSICTTLKNRCIVETEYGTRYLFKNFLESIQKSHTVSNCEIELVISDFQSTDIHNLYEYTSNILNNKKIPIKIISLKRKFNRGFGLNIAIHEARYDTILVLDVDMKFNKNLFTQFINYTCKNNLAYFPICYTYEKDPTEHTGFWLDVGYGNFGCLKKHWIDSGKIPEYNKWGKEDLDFYHKLQCNKVRERCDNFIHQWHPNDLAWKNRYY